MRYIVKNKFLSPTGSSKILDEDGKLAYKVKGRFFSITKKKRICDLEGNVLFTVKNKWFNWINHTAYVFNADGEQIGVITRNKYGVKNRYTLEEFEDEIEIKGDFFSVTLDVLVNKARKAIISREFSFFVDKFSLETEDVGNVPLYLALVIAIDNLGDKRRKEK